MDRVDCAVIGAGVIGLAVARALAQRGLEVIVLEAERAIGTGTSSRNSEVIHAGIYYASGSFKARLCVQGRELLYRFCGERGVAHQRLGKIIVATSPAELPQLSKYRDQARRNGAGDLAWLESSAVRELEPDVQCCAGLLSPATGIVDSHGLMLAFQADLEAAGGVVVLGSPVTGGRLTPHGVELEVGGADPIALQASVAINCAGLAAQEVSRKIDGVPVARVPPGFLAKGHYFTLAGRAPFRHLIYPVADSAGLGTHVTLDLAGHARFGPDVQWVSELDYSVDESRKEAFVRAIQRYYPRLEPDRLQPAYAGIRPKIVGPGAVAADFRFCGPAQHDGCPYIALYGIESPGLTAALAIGEHVEGLLPPEVVRRCGRAKARS